MKRWKQFWTFSGLCLLLLALVPLASAVFGTTMDFGALARRASDRTGVPWTSNLWDVVRLCFAEPGLWLLLLGSAVPSLAAIVTLALVRDRASWHSFLGRWRVLGTSSRGWRDSLLGYGLLVLSVVVCLVLVFELREWLAPGSYAREPGLFSFSLVGALLAAAFLDQGAVLEEAGWRGFATPLLQDRGMTPLAAAVLVGVVWGLWHVPRDVVSGVIERLGVVDYLLLFLPAFVLGTVTVSIVASYFMNRSGGSLLPAIMVHGLANDAIGFAGLASIERALTPYHQITKALPFCLLVVVIVALSGRQLGLRTAAPTGQASGSSSR